MQTWENHLTGSLPFPAETALGSAHISHTSMEKTEGFRYITHYIIGPTGTLLTVHLSVFKPAG